MPGKEEGFHDDGSVEMEFLMKTKEFFHRWGEGIKKASHSPLEISKARLMGMVWVMAGLVYAWYFLYKKGMGFFWVAMSGTIFLQLLAFWEEFKKYRTIKKFSQVKIEPTISGGQNT